MTATVPGQNLVTSAFNGAFGVSSLGYVQGEVMPDPAIIYQRASGYLAASETLAMYGGVAIQTSVPSIGSATMPDSALGGAVKRATSLANTTAFSVFSYGMINTAGAPVPLAGSNMQVQYFGLGSRMRIAVACDPILASLRGGLVNQQVSWDFTNQLLVPYLGTLVVSSGTYVSATGVISLTMAASVTFSPGDSMTLASLTGTGAFASLDGTWTVLTASGTAVTLQGPVGAGAATITGGNATIGGAASQALPVQVLDIQTGNSMTVNYAGAGLGATWNYSGNCAIIRL